jgi:uncharacterized iron-regulated membrane protein
MPFMNESSDALRSGPRLYARLWRWHFFASLIVIPFVLWQSVTGVLYLWHRELASLTHPELVKVAPAAGTASYDAQLSMALTHAPRDTLQTIEISDDPSAATVFFFRDGNGLPFPVFVDPHTGRYLGQIESTHWIRGLSRGLHGGWPIQPWGSYLLELGASWAIVMTLTGVFLWWPRNVQGWAGVLYPRVRSAPRIFWRDLHAVVGIYFAGILLAFLLSALPWTTLWGGKLLGSVEKALDQESPVGFFFAGGSHHQGSAAETTSTISPQPTALTLDEVIRRTRAGGANGLLELRLALTGGPINARDDHARAWDEVWLQLDGSSGAVLTKVIWSDFPLLQKFVSLGIDLHEGHFFGRANQIFNTLFAVALIWLSVTGFIGWYQRRPRGSPIAPPKHAERFPRAIVVTAVTLCCALPLLGASVIAIALLDRLLGRALPSAA